jgi:hypothetical protein
VAGIKPFFRELPRAAPFLKIFNILTSVIFLSSFWSFFSNVQSENQSAKAANPPPGSAEAM